MPKEINNKVSDVVGDTTAALPSDKYYDWHKQRLLQSEDGCSFGEWVERSNDHAFAFHPAGFLIFLPPEEIFESDEYAVSDPYTVDQNISSAFHRRRFRCTLELLQIALGNAAASPRILDLGCGEGFITAEMRETFPKAKVSGLDYSLTAIECAHKRFPGIDFVVGNAYNPPYAPGYFDVVVCNNLWEHVPDPSRLLAAIRLVIKPGGYVIISTPSRYRLNNLLKVVLGKPVCFMSKLHVTEYTVGQVKELLHYGKFRCEKAYSEPVSKQTGRPVDMLAYKLIMPLLRMFLRVTGSHHSLESTVFYLGRKIDD